MMQFSEAFPDIQIVISLMSQLSWTHFLQVISVEDGLKWQFYLTMAADQRWSVRTLKAKIDGMLYERTAIAKQPTEQWLVARVVMGRENFCVYRKIGYICAYQNTL